MVLSEQYKKMNYIVAVSTFKANILHKEFIQDGINGFFIENAKKHQKRYSPSYITKRLKISSTLNYTI